MRRIALILMVCANTVLADEWIRLLDSDIQPALEGQIVDYDDAWQEFLPSGRTLYNAGRDSWGHWDVRAGQYCSQWPPAGGWACYDVSQKGALIRFAGQSGVATIGVLRTP